jgi:putative oxidoreductase
MKTLIFKTRHSGSPLFLRVFLALVLFPHGAQKLLGWFGGYGFSGTMQYFTDTVGLPWLIGFLVILIEFLAPIALIVGFATRLWSLAVFFLFLGIMITAHADYFFMNWFGSQPTEGAEYFLLILGMSLSLTVSGAGKFSIDAGLSKNKEDHAPQKNFVLTGARLG